jgi:flagellar hook protein FlgE
VDRSSVAPIQISQSTYNPVATSEVSLAANLPATPTNAGAVNSQVQVYDGLGTAHSVSLSWTQTSPNNWTLNVNAPDAMNGPALGTANVQFGNTSGNDVPSGTPGALGEATGTVSTTGYAAGGPASVSFSADFGQGPQTVSLKLGTFGGTDGVTQYAGNDYTLKGLTQNGIPPGSYSSLSMASSGDVVVNYDNGQSRTVARVPITTFADPDALQREDGQAFTATIGAGTGLTQDAGNNGAGDLVTSATESSNVDIAKEFTKLIVAQRAYSANTKLVTTADELLQQTIDMKR